MTQPTPAPRPRAHPYVSESLIRGMRDAHLIILAGTTDRHTRVVVAAQASVLSVLLGENSRSVPFDVADRA